MKTAGVNAVCKGGDRALLTKLYICWFKVYGENNE